MEKLIDGLFRDASLKLGPLEWQGPLFGLLSVLLFLLFSATQLTL